MLSKRAQSFQVPQNSPVQMYIPVPKSVGTGSDAEKISEKEISKPSKPKPPLAPVRPEKPLNPAKPVKPTITPVKGSRLSKRAGLGDSVSHLAEKLIALGLSVREVLYRTNKAFVVLEHTSRVSPTAIKQTIDWFKKLPGNTIVEVEIRTQPKGSPFVYDRTVKMAYVGPASQKSSPLEYDPAKSTFPDSMFRYVENKRETEKTFQEKQSRVAQKERKKIRLTPEVINVLRKLRSWGTSSPHPIEGAHFDDPKREKENQRALEARKQVDFVWKKLWDLGIKKYEPVVIENVPSDILQILSRQLAYFSYGENRIAGNNLYLTLDYE